MRLRSLSAALLLMQSLRTEAKFPSRNQDASERVDAVNEQEQDDSEKVDAVNDEVINTIRNRSYGDETSLYKYCCAHASDEQRRQLESI